MQDTSLFDQIITQLRTTAELTQVLRSLEAFPDTLFSGKTSEECRLVFKDLPKQLADVLVTHFCTEPLTPENQISIKRQIDEVSDKLRTCKSIQITIAFQPDEEVISLFSDWVKRNVSNELLLDIQLNKTIVGGAQIISAGKFKDYSVHKRLANKFQIQREDIMGLLN